MWETKISLFQVAEQVQSVGVGPTQQLDCEKDSLRLLFRVRLIGIHQSVLSH